MSKIYLMPAYGLSSDQFRNALLKQSPGLEGRWGSISVTKRIDKADFFVVHDKYSMDTPDPKRTIYIGREPPDVKGHATYKGLKNAYAVLTFYGSENSYHYTRWWLNKTYDELVAMDPLLKSRGMSSVVSHKRRTAGQKVRIDFLKELVKRKPESLDLYGRIGKIKFFSDKVKESVFESKHALAPCKFSYLKDYRYCLCFDNGMHRNFISSQFCDAILSWCIPIYWGCPNVNDFYPEKSFISFDAENPKEVDRIVDAIHNDKYEDRLEDLKKARDLILNRYNFWPYIDEAVRTGGITW